MAQANAKYAENLELLDGMSLLELADMPERPALPTGMYQGEFVDLTSDSKEVDGELKVRVNLKIQVMAPLELANEEEAAELASLEEGTQIDYSFYMGNPYGEGSLKRILKSLVAELGLDEGTRVAQIREAMQGKPVCFEVSRRPAKNPSDTNKWDTNLLAVTTASPTELLGEAEQA